MKLNLLNFAKWLNIVRSILYFSQSLSEHFANDDILEPVLMFVANALRKGTNLEYSLRGG